MALISSQIDQICKNADILFEKLQAWNLIPSDGVYTCPACKSGPLKLLVDNHAPDGRIWFCGRKWRPDPKKKYRKCANRTSIRTGTFFACSKLSINQILCFVNMWCDSVALTVICKQLQMTKPTAIDWASFCREVVFDSCILNGEQLGGPGKVVEIDESKFGKRKYHRGHHVEGQWVFGGYERDSGRVFMVAVENRGADTLLPIIRTWIKPGSIIMSDFWKAYDCLENEGYSHLKVNHKLHFKDPETGAHSNSIESSWRAAKSSMTSAGRIKAHIPENLARYMFQKRCRAQKLDPTIEFFNLAGKLYSPLQEGPKSARKDEEPQEDLCEFEDDVE